jgi:hypothetical protein
MFLMPDRPEFQKATRKSEGEPVSRELVALLRLLTREPPPGHDFKTCPICKRFGITKI